MNIQVTPYSALPNTTLRSTNRMSYARRDTAGREGTQPLGIRGAIAGASGLLLAAGPACRLLVRATAAGPVGAAGRRRRSYDRCPWRARI